MLMNKKFKSISKSMLKPKEKIAYSNNKLQNIKIFWEIMINCKMNISNYKKNIGICFIISKFFLKLDKKWKMNYKELIMNIVN